MTLKLLEKVFALMGESLKESTDTAKQAAHYAESFGKRSSVVGILLMLLQDSARELTDEQRQARVKRLGDFALPNESLKLGLAMICVGDNSPLGRDLWDFGVEFQRAHCSCTLGDLFEKYKEKRKRMQEHMRQLFSMPVVDK